METTGIGVGGSGGAKEGRVKEVVLDGVGHLIPMIVPKACAQRAMEWLASELQKWLGEEETWTKEWQAVEKAKRRVLSEEYKKMIGGNPRAKTTAEKL